LSSRSLKKFNNLYNNKFLKVYGDLTAFIGSKPEQILIEEENINAHLVVYLSNQDNKLGKENLEKAYNHLLRCSLDASKILWIEMKKFLDKEFTNFQDAKYYFNISELEINKKYSEFLHAGKVARRSELENIGKDPEKCIDHYYEAISIAWAIIKEFDPIKKQSYKKFKFINSCKENWLNMLISFIAGILSTLVVSVCTGKN
jgi:hypothetical protein